MEPFDATSLLFIRMITWLKTDHRSPRVKISSNTITWKNYFKETENKIEEIKYYITHIHCVTGVSKVNLLLVVLKVEGKQIFVKSPRKWTLLKELKVLQRKKIEVIVYNRYTYKER